MDKPVVTDELLPCRDCGSPCRVEHFEGPHIEGRVSLWICSNHKRFGGDCPSDLAYFDEAAWNTRSTASPQTDQVERVARAIEEAWNNHDTLPSIAFYDGEGEHLARAVLQAIEIDEGLRSALEPFAHYADLNDLAERDPDDAIEVPIRDLLNAKAALRSALEEASDNLEYAEQMLEAAGNDAGAGFCERQVVKFRQVLSSGEGVGG